MTFQSRLFLLGALLLTVATAAPASAQIADSLDELKAFASLDNATVTLAPGEYWLEGDGTNVTFLEFSGSNSTFILSGAQIKMDTRELAGYGNGEGVRPITVTGDDNFIQGLDFAGVDVDLDTDPNARRRADRSAVYLQVTGNDNMLVDTTLFVRGSSPYGYGDVFGKGARFPESGLPVEDGGFAFLSHNKTSSFLITGGAENTIVDNLNLTSRSYGHGFFVQGGASNTTIRNSTISGQLVSSNDAIAHPEYQEYAAGADGILGTSDDGGTRSGTPLPPNIFLSAQEDGIRMYTGTTGLTVENCVVSNFRSGVSSTFANGTVSIDNVEVYGTENGFVVGSNTTITNCKADIVNGPAIYVQYNDDRNSTIDIEIVGDRPVGEDWAVAYVNGDNFDVTIRSDLPQGFFPEDSLIRFGQTWFNNWRDQLRPTGPETASPGPFTNSTFTNLTNDLMVLGNAATGNSGFSQSGVVPNGKDNDYDGISVVLSGSRVVLTDTAGLGNNGVNGSGNFDPDVFETNASFVFDGATLELEPGIRISQEKLTITGDGVDGQGALYSDGTVGTDTRFGSASGGENSAIFLDGDASIGVGVAGNQMNIGGINGQGDFTKRGPGMLTVGKASNFDGDFIVAEGQVSARSNTIRNNLIVAAGASISANGDGAYNTDGAALINGELDLNARSRVEQLEHRVGSLFGSGSVFLSNNQSGSEAMLELGSDAADAVFQGDIAGAVSIEKSGFNSQTLSGLLFHTGTTTVTDGGLFIDATHIGGGDYTVLGGTLGGSGTIDSGVTVGDGGIIEPGFATGIFSADSVDFESGSVLSIDIASLTDFDQLLLNQALIIDPGATLNINVLDGFVPTVGDEFNILDFGSSSGVFGTVSTSSPGSEIEWDLSRLQSEGVISVLSDGTSVLLGDCNRDGVVSFLDISPFIAILSAGGYLDEANVNQDDVVSFSDIAPFISILSGS